MKTNIKNITSFVLGFIALVSAQTALSAGFGPPVNVTGVDTIAGYSTSLTTSRGADNEDIVFRIESPSGTILELESTTNEIGVSSVDVYGFHTQTAGEYSVSAYYRDYASERPPINFFEVFPDTVSATHSSLKTNMSSLPAGEGENVLLTVRLKDKYGNPISNHQLTVISSRSDDLIFEVAPNTPTDERGEKIFRVSSSAPGVSYLSVLDRATGTTLEERAKLVFFEPDASPTGGSLLQANIFENTDTTSLSGPIARFKLEFTDGNDNADVAVVGSDQNYFRITAVDTDDNTVRDYTGSILISAPDDPKALLPNNGQYTFRGADAGSFEFSLAFQFSEIGTQMIEVFEYNPETGEIFANIKGSKEIEVVQSGGIDDDFDDGSDAKGIEIKTPEDGSAFATAEVALTGKGNPNTDLRVFVDNTEIDEVSTDIDGVFFTTLSNIAEGDHELYVQEIEGSREFSVAVSFSVDTTPPTLQSVSVFPETVVDAGGVLTFSLVSEPNLGKAMIRLDGEEHELEEIHSKPGNYEGAFSASQNAGEYSADVILEDDLGNESKFLSEATLLVRASEVIPPSPKNIKVLPLQEAVHVNWEKVEGHVEEIVLYVIYMGTSEFSLSEKTSVAPTESSTVIDELEAGKEYFFAVTAVDMAGNMSEQSQIFSARPLFSEKISSRITAVSRDGSIDLSWEQSLQDPDLYIVEYGIESGRYVERMLVAGESTQKNVYDLINGLTYYFTVTPYKNGSPTSEETYGEVSSTPESQGLHAAAKSPAPIINVPKYPATGPEAAFVFVGISFLATAYIVQRRKKHAFIN